MKQSNTGPHSYRRLTRLQSHLSYANVISTLALFLVLGGASYAAVTLPRNSVGREQLRRHAVTHSKLASRSVTRRSLSAWVRSRVENGENGASGTAGPAGSPGRDGVGASRLHFSAAAESAPTPVTALDTAGLKLTAACRQSGSTVGLEITARSSEDAVIQETAGLDTGSDPNTFGTSSNINGQITLAANTDTLLGGPTADPPDYFRVIATLVYVSTSRTMPLSIVVLVNAASGRCSVDGAAVPTS